MLHLLASMTMWGRLWAIGNVAVSLILGALLFALCFIYYEDTMLVLIKQAAVMRDWIVSYRSWPKAEIVTRLVLHESTILFMFFTIAARIILSLVTGILSFIFRR
jgi:hypothetical protein